MTDAERLDQLLARQEASIAKAFRDFLAIVQSAEIMRQIIDQLEKRDLNAAMAIVDSYILRFADVLPAVAAAVGQATASELAALIPDLALAVSFDPSHPRAAEIIQAGRAKLVRQFTAQQRQSTSQALERAYRAGLGEAAAARSFRGSIGLTAYQEQVVANYRQSLETLDRNALERALRDRRYDPTIEAAIERDRPLTSNQIDRMVERYRGRMLIMRSETIARTEGVRATAEAREESLVQMAEQTGIAVQRFDRIWNTTKDRRRRDWHGTMEHQRRKVGEDFLDGHGNRLRYPGDPRAPAETVINCRCGITFALGPA